MISAGGFPAYQMVLGSNLADSFSRGGNEEVLALTQDTSLSGQFAQHWKLRLRAQEAALKEDASSKLRRLLAYNKSCNCTDIAIGDSALFYRAPNRKSSLRRRGPAKILDMKQARRRHFSVRPSMWRDILRGDGWMKKTYAKMNGKPQREDVTPGRAVRRCAQIWRRYWW